MNHTSNPNSLNYESYHPYENQKTSLLLSFAAHFSGFCPIYFENKRERSLLTCGKNGAENFYLLVILGELCWVNDKECKGILGEIIGVFKDGGNFPFFDGI